MRVLPLVLAISIAALSAAAPLAQENAIYFSPELTSEFSAPSAFEGLYAGVLFGPISSRMNNFNVTGATIRPEFGAVVGWNQPVAPGVVLGGELQASLATDFSTSAYLRAMALARLGFAAGDNGLVYVLGGVGRMGEGWAFEAGLGADVSGDGASRRHPDTELVLPQHLHQLVVQFAGGGQRGAGGVGMLDRGTEDGQRRVALELVDEPAVFVHGVDHDPEEVV